ncbi:MAG: hypothetical protein JW863_20100 [Chitinispirillaceae bacterium]|nr:hypothetical protein [Chitinispirillaceae bacterium]
MKKLTVLWTALAVMTLAGTALGQFSITLNQNYTGAPGNMIVQTDAYGNLTGDKNAPLVLPSPTRSGFDFRGWFTTSAATGGERVLSGATGTKFTANTTIYARWTTQTKRTLSDCPATERAHFDWLKDVRNKCEVVITGSGTSGGNLQFHQLYAGGGSINYAVRWESDQTVTLKQRRDIAGMLYDGVNEWIRPLMGYEDFPFGEIPVSVVGWTVQKESLILDKQPNELIWVSSNHEPPNSGYTTGFMCSAPRERSRFINYNTINRTSGGPNNYKWPESIGGRNGRYDMYLWLTQNKEGGNGSAEGGDWGFRWGNQGTNGAAVSAAATHSSSGSIHGTMLHEIGHSFGFYDWYGGLCCGCTQRNPNGYKQCATMMDCTYNTGTTQNPGVNQYDQWQIRYYYTWVKSTSPADRWNYTPVPWVESTTGITTMASRTTQQPQFSFDSHGALRYNLGGAQTADLRIYDSRGRTVKTMLLSGTATSVNFNLNIAPQMLMWSVATQGKVMDQGRMPFAAK